jgi:hypothetical protein
VSATNGGAAQTSAGAERREREFTDVLERKKKAGHEFELWNRGPVVYPTGNTLGPLACPLRLPNGCSDVLAATKALAWRRVAPLQPLHLYDAFLLLQQQLSAISPGLPPCPTSECGRW